MDEADDRASPAPDKTRSQPVSCNGMAGGAYLMAFVGALIYFIRQASGFWDGVLGVLKAIVWPAVLVYELLKMAGA